MYIVRADGNVKIGAGHLMRCMTIAEALAKRVGDRQEIYFFCADEDSAAMAENAGFRTKILGTDYRDMEAELPVWEQYLEQDKAMQENMQHVILVDSYYVTDNYLAALRKFGKVYLLDDMQEHSYPVDVVINYNVFADKEIYAKLYEGTGTRCLIGSDYVPVREQFLNSDYRIAGTVKNVMITTGGGDEYNIAGKMLDAIYCKDFNFHVVTGRYNPHMQELKEREKSCPGVHIYHDVKNMAELMEKCDLAITAGGSTIYELASVGVPILCFSYAKNQEPLTAYIGDNKIAGFLGEYHLNEQAVLERLRELFAEYADNAKLRKACYEKERKMIDGKGTERLAESLYRENYI